MKKIYIMYIISMLLILNQCSLPSTSTQFYDAIYWYDITTFNIPDWVDTPEEIYNWCWSTYKDYSMNSHIKYSKYNTWGQDIPQHVLDNKKASCKGMSLLQLSIYRIRCQSEGKLDLGELDGVGHTECNYNNIGVITPNFIKSSSVEFKNIANHIIQRYNNN